jgi:hypothetical protein
MPAGQRKIPDDFEEKKYRRRSWVEILTAALEEETPDEGRLEALKAMLHALNQLNATDAQRASAIVPFRIAEGAENTVKVMTVLQANMFLNNGDTRRPRVFNLCLSESMRLPTCTSRLRHLGSDVHEILSPALTGDVIERAPT